MLKTVSVCSSGRLIINSNTQVEVGSFRTPFHKVSQNPEEKQRKLTPRLQEVNRGIAINKLMKVIFQ